MGSGSDNGVIWDAEAGNAARVGLAGVYECGGTAGRGAVGGAGAGLRKAGPRRVLLTVQID